MIINYKNKEVYRTAHAVPWHPILIDLHLWIIDRYPESIMTEAFRKGDPKNHGTNPLRGFDLRSWTFKAPEKVAEHINKYWIYDPVRPGMRVVVLHAVCPKCKTNHDIINTKVIMNKCMNCQADISNNWHFHCQTHPNTIFKGD